MSKYFQDLTTPFNKFIECLVNKNYNELIIDGNPTNDELIQAWQSIYELYIENCGSEDVKIKIEQAKEIAQLEGKIKLAELIINQLKIAYSNELISTLAQFGYPISIEPSKDNLERYIKQFVGFLNHDVLKLQEKINEIPKEEEINEKVEINRQYFEKIIVAIELTFKKDIDIDKITTAKYCEYVKAYNDYVKNLQSRIKKE